MRSDASNPNFPHFSPIFTTYVAYLPGGTAQAGPHNVGVGVPWRDRAGRRPDGFGPERSDGPRGTCERSEAQALDLIEIT